MAVRDRLQFRHSNEVGLGFADCIRERAESLKRTPAREKPEGRRPGGCACVIQKSEVPAEV
jgi:hypothetical protein